MKKNIFTMCVLSLVSAGCTTNYVAPTTGKIATIRLVAGDELPPTSVYRLESNIGGGVLSSIDGMVQNDSLVVNEKCEKRSYMGSIASYLLLRGRTDDSTKYSITHSIPANQKFALLLSSGAGRVDMCELAFEFDVSQGAEYEFYFNWDHHNKRCYVKAKSNSLAYSGPMLPKSEPVKLSKVECDE